MNEDGASLRPLATGEEARDDVQRGASLRQVRRDGERFSLPRDDRPDASALDARRDDIDGRLIG